MATDVTDEEVFRIRQTARLRTRTSVAPLPEHVTVRADGSVVAADQDGDRLTRYESVGECLVEHDLKAIDFEPIDSIEPTDPSDVSGQGCGKRLP